jgi:hypothetical protein
MLDRSNGTKDKELNPYEIRGIILDAELDAARRVKVSDQADTYKQRIRQSIQDNHGFFRRPNFTSTEDDEIFDSMKPTADGHNERVRKDGKDSFGTPDQRIAEIKGLIDENNAKEDRDYLKKLRGLYPMNNSPIW